MIHQKVPQAKVLRWVRELRFRGFPAKAIRSCEARGQWKRVAGKAQRGAFVFVMRNHRLSFVMVPEAWYRTARTVEAKLASLDRMVLYEPGDGPLSKAQLMAQKPFKPSRRFFKGV